MKKIILMMALAIGTSTAFAQGVIGTDDVSSKDFEFQTNGLMRATWLGTGPLVHGAGTDPDGTGYARKVVLSTETDLMFYNDSHIYMTEGLKIYGGNLANYSGGTRATYNNYLMMNHAGDGSVLLNSGSNEIFLQPSGSGVVHVGRTYNASITTTNDKLYVDGSATAKGYCASIKEVASSSGSTYAVTNDDYTILVTGNSNNVTITLPTNTVEHGRMFNIKNLMTDGKTVTITNGDNGGNPVLAATGDGVTIQLLFTSPGTWTYHIISTM